VPERGIWREEEKKGRHGNTGRCFYQFPKSGFVQSAIFHANQMPTISFPLKKEKLGDTINRTSPEFWGQWIEISNLRKNQGNREGGEGPWN
jgi:hypothetical protein